MVGTLKKAGDLVDYYYKLVEFDYSRNKQKSSAKKCANKAVEEILDAMKPHHITGSDELEFWYEVQRHIWDF